MAFPVIQNPLDWFTQYWNILLGKRVNQDDDDWLLGPIGVIREGLDEFVARIANERGLRVEGNIPYVGIVENLDDWPRPIRSSIVNFYTRTSCYEFDVRSFWRPIFGSLGYLVAMLFSRRIQQLNLPRDTGGGSIGLASRLIKLINSKNQVEYTIWHRYVKETGECIFWGVYTTCKIPSGDFCVKAIFPLPCGSATVLFKPMTDVNGNLLLDSSGKKYGDPGFYFIVKDSIGALWKHYLPSLRESISISEDDRGVLYAEHTLRLWFLKAYSMAYRITEKE